MASKTKPPTEYCVAERRQDETAGSSLAPTVPSTRRLVSRIAQTLQISEAALYDAPDAVWLPHCASEAEARTAELDAECAALVFAYRRIDDTRIRHRLLSLVQRTVNDN